MFGRRPRYNNILLKLKGCRHYNLFLPFHFLFSSLNFLLNNYFVVVVGEAKSSQSQSFHVFEKHP